MSTSFKILAGRFAMATAGSLLLAACGADVGTAPSFHAPAVGGAASAVLPSSDLQPVEVLGRTSGLKKNVTVSAAIGPAGGTLKIGSVGFTLVVPPGAVTQMVNFSVTALAGDAVAYEFAPHGIVFLQPLQFQQKLKGTNWGDGALSGGYFQGAGQVNTTGLTALLNERLDATIEDAPDFVVDGKYVTFNIWHFSGYLVSSGRSKS